MSALDFPTVRRTRTEYRIVDDWERALPSWLTERGDLGRRSHLLVFSDDTVWGLYGERLRSALGPLGLPVEPVLVPPGEDAKDFGRIAALVERLIELRVHRRDLVLCLGGGVCCDLGGLLALIYLRGLDYVLLPTSLMAQIDAAIGGKVGANYGLRKNLLGGFHHPLAVFIDPAFLETLPQPRFVSALAEAVKVAMIRGEEPFIDLLQRRGRRLLARDPEAVRELVELCLAAKLRLLEDDPYEHDLDRVLNLGHAVAHALERLSAMPGGLRPDHGEAVAIGLAAVVRYARAAGLCSARRADLWLDVLSGLGLPGHACPADAEGFRAQLDRIAEHRGGSFRLVVPEDEGVAILDDVDLDLLVRCVGASEERVR